MPDRDRQYNNIYAVVEASSNNVWAVGYDYSGGTLIEDYGTCATVTSTPSNAPSPTHTPGGPTDTPVLGTPTATSCPIQFADVPPDHTFYAYIRCLACRGVINGYNDAGHCP